MWTVQTIWRAASGRRVKSQLNFAVHLQRAMRSKRAGLREIWRRREGAGAVEFAIVSPIFILLVFGIAIYGKVFANYIAVQELAAEAARATVAGLNNSERATLATSFVTNNISGYPLLNPSYVTVATNSQTNAFKVTITYNMANDPVFRLGGNVPLPGTTLTGSAAVQNGGY